MSEFDEFDDIDDFEFGGDVADEDLMALEAAEASTGTTTTSHPTFQRASTFARPSLPNKDKGKERSVADVIKSLPQQTITIDDFDDLPSDAFDSSLMSVAGDTNNRFAQISFRQTTLLGETLQDEPSQHQHTSNYAYVADRGPEKVTHHKIDRDAMATWVYPTNLGAIRDYQFTIVKSSLFTNTLVALPTGLGKTFIAATVMLNYFRWLPDAKLIFCAPTKPLVSQQVDACLQISGIPRSQTALLTGDMAPALRERQFKAKRLFFMTPQTLQNDLSKGFIDPKSVALLVIDEAHRATGDYAYVKIITFLRRFTNSFRVLALTATPGASVDTVQDVIDNLGIAHVEIRTEESIDIRKYVHDRELERITLEPSMEMGIVSELFSKALKPFCDRLSQQNVWYGRDPMSISTFGLVNSQKEWLAGPGRQANQGLKMMMMGTFGFLKSMGHSVKLLTFHGIQACYDNLKQMRTEAEKDAKGSKARKSFFRDANTQEMMMTMERWMRDETFETHPKLTALKEQLAEFFLDKGPDSGSKTRAIVFSDFRDSAEDIVRALNRHVPNVKASVFVGQADSKRSAGMKQADQIRTIEAFKQGEFNVLVATSIGEEGLDIGQVDLIVCYDASASPIRMLQRMGRTGRKRAGRVILLLMKGKEEDKFAEAQDKYLGIQRLICDGARTFNYRDDLSERIVPRNIKPTADKRHVEIPEENTLPDPDPHLKKRAGRVPKASKKKFFMPDGVETGFVTASTVDEEGQTTLGFQTAKAKPKAVAKAKPAQTAKEKQKKTVAEMARPDPAELALVVDIPDLETALASARGSKRPAGAGTSFSSLLSSFGPDQHDTVIDKGDYRNFCKLQKTSYLDHGAYTRRTVQLVSRLGKGAYDRPRDIGDAYLRQKVPRFVTDSGVSEEEDIQEVQHIEEIKSESEKEDSAQEEVVQAEIRRPITLSLPRTAVRPIARPATRPAARPATKPEPASPSPEPEPKRGRSSFAPKKTQRERLTAVPYYGGSEVKDEEEEESRWSKKRPARPAVKGMTKWRSSQFQSYNFAGGRDEDEKEDEKEEDMDDDKDDFPKFELKSKTTKARAALPQYNSRPAGSALLTRPAVSAPVASAPMRSAVTKPVAKVAAKTTAKMTAKAAAKSMHSLMDDFSEPECEKVEEENDVDMELALELDRERRMEEERQKEERQKEERQKEERQKLERLKEEERLRKERLEKEQEQQRQKEKENIPPNSSFSFDDNLEDLEELLDGVEKAKGKGKEVAALVELSDSDVDPDSDVDLPARPPSKPQSQSRAPRPVEPSTDMSEPCDPARENTPDMELPDAPNDTVELPSYAHMAPPPPPAMITMSYPPAYGEPVTASYNPNARFSTYNMKHEYKEHNNYNAETNVDNDHSSQPVVIKFSQPAGTGNSLRRGPSRGRGRGGRGGSVGRGATRGRGRGGGRGGRSAREFSAILEDEAEETGFDGFGYDGYDSYDEYGNGRNKGKGQKGRGNLEEQGDDCLRTSDNYESDGSDSGGDLVGFVVDDDEESELPSSFVEPPKKSKKAAKKKTRVIASSPIESSPVRTTLPVRLSQTMDSEGSESESDVPVRKSRAKKPPPKAKKPAPKKAAPKKAAPKKSTMPPPKSAEFILSEDDSSDAAPTTKEPVRRRRQVVDSSD